MQRATAVPSAIKRSSDEDRHHRCFLATGSANLPLLQKVSERESHAVTPTLPDAVTALPVMALADDVAAALSSGNVLLSAEPGAGKSTGLPLALLSSEAVAGRIVMLEPRRLAARMVASRLAAHLGEEVGERIGLRMRGDTRVSARTRLPGRRSAASPTAARSSSAARTSRPSPPACTC